MKTVTEIRALREQAQSEITTILTKLHLATGLCPVELDLHTVETISPSYQHPGRLTVVMVDIKLEPV